VKTTKHLPRLAIVGIGYLVSLAATFAMVPPAVWRYDVVAPAMSAAALMLLFGPFLLADGQLTIIADYDKISQQKNNYKDGGNE